LRRVAIGLAIGASLTISAPLLAEAPKNEAAGEASRELFFGDLHVHSSWSFDAYSALVTVGPNQAYDYAQGKPIPHISGETIQLKGPPLDFMALTEHAEYLGVVQAASNAAHPIREQPLIKSWRGQDKNLRVRAWRRINSTFRDRAGLPALTHDSVLRPAWKALINLANQHYRPDEFTTLIGFEYTSNPDGQNLHRNVLFRTDSAPTRPFSAMDSPNPEDLWRWMDTARTEGHELLSIPHNANGSNGLMFAMTQFDGSPIDRAWAELRARNEPLAEIMQIKGQSETHPALSPNDPWAEFEIVDRRTTSPDLASQPDGSYVRQAQKNGLAIEAKHGVNPYALGVIGSTDGHNAASPFEESNYTGKIGSTDPTREARLRPGRGLAGETEPVAGLLTRWGAAGLAGVWAESNTREAIWDALRRRETFATSGTRIRVRVRGGWSGDEAAQTSMGATLPNRPNAKAVPVFDIEAQRDPLSAPLERVQVIKGWVANGATHERVFDVVCARGAKPDPKTRLCEPDSPHPNLETCAFDEMAGHAELRTSWSDPEFDPNAKSFYTVRVLEIPTCRWSTWDARRLKQEPPVGVPAAIQERAVTSPIWTR